MKLFVGLDVSLEKLDACFMTDDDELYVLKEATFGNDLYGANLIKETILEYNEEYVFDKIVVGMEATSLYSFHPAMFFNEDKDLNQFNLHVSVEQPNKIKRYREIFEENKNDRIDAFYIADYFRTSRINYSILKEEQYQALQHLTRSRFQLVEQLVTAKQHFIENVSYKCNTLSKELKADNKNTSVLSATMVKLMTEEYSLDDLATMPFEELTSLIQELGRGRFKNPKGIAEAITRATRNSYRLGKIHQSSVDFVLGILAREIRSFEKLIKDIDKSIEDLVKTFEEYTILTSIPGVGHVFAAGIIAEIGQIDRFENDAKIAKYAGLTWNQKQSGKTDSENKRLAKRGNRYLRYYLVEATNQVRRHTSEYADYYQRKYDSTPIHKHKRAIVLSARKFVRLVDTLLRNHQLYVPEEGRSVK